LSQHECLLYAYHAVPDTWRLTGPERTAVVEVTGTLIANNGHFLVEAACHGLGLVFVPVFHTLASLRAGRLVRVLPDWRLSLTVAAVFPNARHVPAKVRVFIDFLTAHFQKAPWADVA
jgi:DNA-binding transcriptional LysR family regulator